MWKGSERNTEEKREGDKGTKGIGGNEGSGNTEDFIPY
jgi:hypothetical protein